MILSAHPKHMANNTVYLSRMCIIAEFSFAFMFRKPYRFCILTHAFSSTKRVVDIIKKSFCFIDKDTDIYKASFIMFQGIFLSPAPPLRGNKESCFGWRWGSIFIWQIRTRKEYEVKGIAMIIMNVKIIQASCSNYWQIPKFLPFTSILHQTNLYFSFPIRKSYSLA